MVNGAYCVCKVHTMLPQKYYDIWSILCMLGTQYATSVLLLSLEHIV